eukprot:1064457-Amphidinium_carterae.2
MFHVEGTEPPPCEVRDKLPQGALGRYHSTYQCWVALDGNAWHAVEASQGGLRYSVSLFTAGNLHLLTEVHWKQLVELQFPVGQLRTMCTSKRVSALMAELMIVETMSERMTRGFLEAGIVDTSSGKELDAQLVAEARKEELTFLRNLGAYKVVAREGRRVIPVGWVTVNKGDEENPRIRSRLVVKETKYHSTLEEGAGNATTPPYESLRFLLSIAMSQEGQARDQTLQFIDITRAHPAPALQGGTRSPDCFARRRPMEPDRRALWTTLALFVWIERCFKGI